MRSVLVLAAVVGVLGAPVAIAATKQTSALHKKKPSKKLAKKKGTRAKHAQAAKRPLVHIPRKPTVAVASHHGDGRVRYGRDNFPPGFAWPETAPMKHAEKACEQELEAAGVTWQPAKPEGFIADPIQVPAMELGGIRLTPAYSRGPVTLDCQLARVLVKIGPDLHALGVREIRFGSVYRNTLVRVHGQTKNILSRHALGLAMDIKSFVDETGRVADVELDYLKGDALLHSIEDTVNRSTDFRIVLTPGNDPLSHSDHFHIEASVDFTAFR